MGLGKPVNWWRLNETTGTSVADIISGVNGTATSGNARRFNGTSDYIQFANQIIPIGAKTIRFKFRKNGNPSTYNPILDNADWYLPNNGTTITVNSNGTVTFFSVKGNASVSRFSVTSTTSVCDNKWHELMFTWDGTTNTNGVKIYIDDMVTPNAQGTANALETVNATYGLTIGRYVNNATYSSFDIDDIQITNGYMGNGTVVAWWKCDDGSASAFVDSSTNWTTSTISGTTVISSDSMPIIVSDGQGGYCRRFNGRSDRITFTSQVIPLGTRTIKFKVKIFNNPTVTYTIMSNTGSANNGTWIMISTTGQIRFASYKGTGSSTPRFNIFSNKTIGDNQWHEVVCTWDGTTNADGVKIFIDDMNVADVSGTAVSSETTSSTYNLSIGSNYNTSATDFANYFQGDLKDILISTGTGNERTDVKDLKVGDFIPCKYTAPTSGQAGYFTNLGVSPTSFIPPTSSATPNGSFYLIHSGYDYKGRMKLIADRNIQHSISWDALNSEGIVNGVLNPRGYNWSSNVDLLNYDVAKTTYNPILTTYNNEVYCTWSESNGVKNIIRVKKYDGTSWVFVDGGANGLNYNVNQSGGNPYLIVYNNELYCSWQEYNGTVYNIRIKKYNGTTWTFVDGNGTNGINYDNNRTSSNSYLTVYNNELYCSWQESNGNVNLIRVRKYNGTSWTWVDGGTNGLNYSNAQSGANSRLVTYNNELYCAWNEYNGSRYQIRVKKYNGTTWTFVDGTGNANGINYSTSYDASSPYLIVYNNELYCSWQEYTSTYYYQVRIKKYNGTTWTFVDGNGTNGINYDVNKDASNIVMVIFNGELHSAWCENNSTTSQIRVKRYNNSTWISADGGSTTGLNYDNTRAGSMVGVTVCNNELYCAWTEFTGTVSQVRVRAKKKIPLNLFENKYNMTLRLLTGGTSATDFDNEWDKIIVGSNLNNTITAGDNNVWNWANMYTWTSTVSTSTNTYRVNRGYATVSSYYNSQSSSLANTTLGFRPVLLVENISKFCYFIKDNKGIYSLKNGFYNLGNTLSDNQILNYYVANYTPLTTMITTNTIPSESKGALGTGVLFESMKIDFSDIGSSISLVDGANPSVQYAVKVPYRPIDKINNVFDLLIYNR